MKKKSSLQRGGPAPGTAAAGPGLCAAQRQGGDGCLHAAGGGSAGFPGCSWRPRRSWPPSWGSPLPAFCGWSPTWARAYLEDSSQDLARVYDADSAIALFRPKFLGRSTEAVCLMLLDSRGRLLYNDFITEGAVSAVPIYIRPLLQLCIRYDAQHVLLAHNHPSGNAAASRNDITATRQVEMALESIEATLNDHIIFAGEDTLSFAQCGWLGQIKEEVRDYRREELQAAREQEAAILWGDSLL